MARLLVPSVLFAILAWSVHSLDCGNRTSELLVVTILFIWTWVPAIFARSFKGLLARLAFCVLLAPASLFLIDIACPIVDASVSSFEIFRYATVLYLAAPITSVSFVVISAAVTWAFASTPSNLGTARPTGIWRRRIRIGLVTVAILYCACWAATALWGAPAVEAEAVGEVWARLDSQTDVVQLDHDCFNLPTTLPEGPWFCRGNAVARWPFVVTVDDSGHYHGGRLFYFWLFGYRSLFWYWGCWFA
jgi:hypothetical protein